MEYFHRFPELPDEVQMMVWEFALAVPQVIAIQARTTSRYEWYSEAISSHSPLLPVNRMSRQLASKVQKQHQKLVGSGTKGYHATLRDGAPPFYLNPQIDTLWLTNFRDLTNDILAHEALGAAMTVFKPGAIKYKKTDHPTNLSKDFRQWVVTTRYYYRNTLRSIAISVNFWKDIMKRPALEIYKIINVILQLGPLEEIILVVSRIYPTDSTFLCLRPPTQATRYALPKSVCQLLNTPVLQGTPFNLEKDVKGKDTMRDFLDWSRLEQNAQDVWEGFKLTRAINRNRVLQVASLPQTAKEAIFASNHGAFADCSHWKIPKFRFKEIAALNPQ